MKLYDSRRAPNPRRVRWFMAEKGIEDVEIVEVDIFSGQHRTPDYMARAGLPNVPALEMDDGTTITESVAICRYLESVYPEPNLFGRDPRETAIIEMWARRAEMLVATPLMLTVRHSHPALAAIETQVPEVAANNRAAAEKGIKVLDRRLADSPFIAGDRVTIADILAVTGIDFARMARFRPDPALVNVKRWLDEMNARPAAKAGV
ncbi:glutathione S-transferase [Caulobacter sp. D4A]|uniref:glutathione S-transferase family protein n=1 Tax=unclassified Caulobacter TaxID=2648921 RepID=UPI000D732FED|nr:MULTISPECIES: glutathione S-transferase [unclassified Caulobacter]PXA83792.1 glutathione S-transferase [Caulobacter sp. D4A]PXA92477.1 glutathione S-transferase [Caulobacter sp. D5]